MASDYLLSQYIQQTLQIPVFALHAPVNATFPCVVYEKLSSLGSVSMDGPSFSTDVFTFSVKSKVGLAQARLYGSQINALLNGYENQVFSVANSYSEEYDDSEEVYVVSQNFQCIVGATLPFYNVVRGDGFSGSIAIWNDKFALTSSNNIIVSGSDIRITGNLTVVGTIDNQISASLLTASYAVHADTASYMAGAIESASYAATAAFALNVPATASHALVADLATTASYALNTPTLPDGLVSSSAQIDYTSIQNKPTSIESASYAATASYALNTPTLPEGLVSSSAQVLNGSNVYSSSAQLPAGLVSSSAQVLEGTGIVSGSTIATASYVKNAETASFVQFAKTAGSSSHANWSDVSGVSTSASFSTTASYVLNAVSASYSLNATSASYIKSSNVSFANSGIVSSSAQVDYTGIQNKPTTIATASYVLHAVSSSYAPLPSGVVSSSAQVFTDSGVYSSSIQLPAGILSSSAQLPSGIVSGSEQIANWSVLSSSYAVSSSHAVSASWAPQPTVPETSSYALQALSASWAPSQPAVSASYAATASTWNGYNVWVGTTAQYNALSGSYDAATLYFVKA